MQVLWNVWNNRDYFRGTDTSETYRLWVLQEIWYIGLCREEGPATWTKGKELQGDYPTPENSITMIEGTYLTWCDSSLWGVECNNNSLVIHL